MKAHASTQTFAPIQMPLVDDPYLEVDAFLIAANEIINAARGIETAALSVLQLDRDSFGAAPGASSSSYGAFAQHQQQSGRSLVAAEAFDQPTRFRLASVITAAGQMAEERIVDQLSRLNHMIRPEASGSPTLHSDAPRNASLQRQQLLDEMLSGTRRSPMRAAGFSPPSSVAHGSIFAASSAASGGMIQAQHRTVVVPFNNMHKKNSSPTRKVPHHPIDQGSPMTANTPTAHANHQILRRISPRTDQRETWGIPMSGGRRLPNSFSHNEGGGGGDLLLSSSARNAAEQRHDSAVKATATTTTARVAGRSTRTTDAYWPPRVHRVPAWGSNREGRSRDEDEIQRDDDDASRREAPEVTEENGGIVDSPLLQRYTSARARKYAALYEKILARVE